MQLRTNFLSRFLGVFLLDSNGTTPSGNSDACSSSRLTSDSDPPCTDSKGNYQVMEIPDSDEESDLEVTATTVSEVNSAPSSGKSSGEPYMTTRNRSLSDLSDASPCPGDKPFDSSEVWSEKDNDDVSNSPTGSMPSFDASLGNWKNTLSDPRSSIWKGRVGAKLAVVLLSTRKSKGKLDSASTLRALSASKQNVIAGKNFGSQEQLSISRIGTGARPRLHGGRFAIFLSGVCLRVPSSLPAFDQ
jgi:hypothetical protein